MPTTVTFSTPLQQVDPAFDYGYDVTTYPEFDPTMQVANSPRNVAECVVRRWHTQRGFLPFHDDDGVDLQSFLNETIDADALFRLKTALQLEALKDERVLACDVSVTFESRSSALSISAELDLASGPFKFAVFVTQLTAGQLGEQ